MSAISHIKFQGNFPLRKANIKGYPKTTSEKQMNKNPIRIICCCPINHFTDLLKGGGTAVGFVFSLPIKTRGECLLLSLTLCGIASQHVGICIKIGLRFATPAALLVPAASPSPLV